MKLIPPIGYELDRVYQHDVKLDVTLVALTHTDSMYTKDVILIMSHRQKLDFLYSKGYSI